MQLAGSDRGPAQVAHLSARDRRRSLMGDVLQNVADIDVPAASRALRRGSVGVRRGGTLALLAENPVDNHRTRRDPGRAEKSTVR